MKISNDNPTWFRPTSDVGFHKIFCTDATFDLYCTCDDDSRVIVECQNACDVKEFMNRALAYSAMAILDKAHKKWHYMFDKVYFVGLLNFKMWRNRPQAFTKVALYTADDHTLANDNYLQIFVELPKLVAKKDDEERKQYEESMTTVEDLMSYARVQREEGREEGMAKGKAEGKAEMARSMKADGVPVEAIVKYSGLSEAEIKAL